MHLTMEEGFSVQYVFLDGEDITHKGVVELDTEEGWVRVFARDDEGNLFARDGELAKEVLYGVVTFTLV